MRTLMDSSAFTQVLIFLVLVDILAAAPASRTKGCDKACQRECLEILNKYRANHDASKLQFSQTLADKAQKWADGGKFGYDMDTRGKYGQLIEWDVKDELTSFKAVIKHWHDKEKDYDFIKGKSKNGQTLHDFTQVVWKKAHKAGCGRGRMFGSRYYVVWMDADGTISTKFSPAGNKNVAAPKERDLHWFEVTMMKAVGEPLYQNNTNSTQPGNCQCKNTSQQQDCCNPYKQEIRTKSSVSDDDEDMDGEENVLNDSNNIKNYMHASLNKIFADENKEVAHLRDELEDFGGNPSLQMYNPQLSNNDIAANENEQPEIEQQDNGLSEPSISNMYMNNVDTKERQELEKNIGAITPVQGPSPITTEAGSTDAESTLAAVHDQGASKDKVGGKTTHTLENITPAAAFSKFAHPNHMAGKRLKDTKKSSQKQLREMAGLIMGKVSDKDAQDNISDNQISKEYNSNIVNDDNLKPDMKIELSKVARLIDSRIKALARTKETSTTTRNYGLDVKQEGKEEDIMDLKQNDEPDARPAKITMVGSPLSFPEQIKDKADNAKEDIKTKVKELWKAHLKNKKQKRKQSEQFESDVYQDSGEDNDGNEGSKSKKKNNDDTDTVTVEDLNQLHGYQYLGNGRHHDYNAMNPMNGQPFQQNTLNHGFGFNGMQPPGHVHPSMGGDWFSGPMGFSQGLGNPLSPSMGTGSLYDYRKKFTNEEPEQQSESGKIQNSEDFSGNKDTSTQPMTQQDQNTREDEHNGNSENEPALEPIKAPEGPVENKETKNGPLISQDHHDVLTLPKELQFHEEEDQEKLVANNLPEMISENPSVSTSSEDSDTQPGFFNEDFSPPGPPYRYQNDQPSNTASPQSQSQPSYNYPMQAPTSTQTPMVAPSNQPLQDYQMQASTSSQQPNQQQRLPQDTMQQLVNQDSSPQQIIRHNSDYRQRPASSMQEVGEQPLQDAAGHPQQILQGDLLQASGKMVLLPHQTGYTLLSDKEKSTKNTASSLELKEDRESSPKYDRNSASKQSNKGADSGMMSTSQISQQQHDSTQDSSASESMNTADGRPMKEPYKSSGVYITKGPFVYQTDTTIFMGGPTESSSKPMMIMNSKAGPSSMPQNSPVQQNLHNPREDNKQDKEIPKQSNKISLKLPNGFDPSLLRRPSLESLLKEAQSENKTSESKKEKEEGGPSDSENKQKPKESEKNSNKTEESNNEKKPEKSEESKAQNESNPDEKRPENSTSKEEGKEKASESSSKSEEKPSKEANESVTSSSDKRPEESSEREKEKEEASQGKEGQSESPVDEKASGEEKEKSGSPEKQKPTGGNETKEEGSSNKESPPKKEKEKNESPENMKQSEKQESSAISEKEVPSSGSSEKEEEESSSTEKEKPLKESSSSEQGKMSGSTVKEKEDSKSSEKEAPTSSSSNEESPLEKEKEKNENPENMKQSEKQESSASSEKEVPSSGSSEREEKESSSTEKEHPPSGSSEKPLKESSSSEQGKMSESAVKEKEEGKSSEKEAPTSGSSNEENPPEKEKEKNENPENMKQSEKQESSASSEKEVPSSGSSEREEKESSSNEKEHSPSGSSLKESSSSEQGKMSESAVKEKEKSKSSEKEAPTNNEQSSSSEKENPVNNPEGQEKEESSSENTQESNNMKTPSESDLVASIRLKQGRIFIEPQQQPQQLQSTDSASQGGRPGKIKENVQANVVPEVASQSNTVTQNQPSNVQANEKTNSNPSITPGEADKVDGVKPKPLIPFDSLLSRINQALGLDSPQSQLKVSSIALASKANSSFHGQPLNDGNGNTLPVATNFEHKIAVDVPEFISNDQRVPQSNFVKIGQFWLNHGRPMDTSSGTSGFRSHENNGMSSNIQQHVVSNNTPGGDTRLSHSGSLTDMVDDLQSGSATRLHQEGGSPVMGKITHPAITHSSCTDTGERCPLWQKRGYCSNVQYADFMKRHCTSTCGYCECKDSQSYAEFSCPAWKAQGYCQKKEKQMKLFCRSTCNFCKRKTIKKKSKHHDEQSKGQPSTNPKYSDGNFAHAQTGDNAGKHIATAQTGNVTSTPQSTAYAQGGNTFVQTQSSSSQQTAYAVTYPAPSPQQHTYSHAQSGSLPGQQSSAHASSDNLNKSSSPKGHKSSAQATIGSAQQVSQMNENPKPSLREKNKHKGFALEDSHDDEIALEEKVMRDSPEYNSADSHGQYFVTTDSDEEQEHSFDEPVMRFPKLNSVAFTKPERNDESTVTEISGNLQQESRDTDADENDMEAKEKEDERINSLVDRFDSEDDDLKENSLMSVDRLEKKGGVDTVETKGCDKSCQKECIETINSYRRNHGAQPLTLNQDLAMHAQEWADMKPYGHSAWAQKGLGGELIAVGSFYNTFTSAVKAWHDEEKNVDWSTGKSNGGEIKHFKQLVFQDASYLGCGKTSINGEPYYIAQMDEAAKDDQDDSDKRESMGEPKTPDLGWYMDSSPYWKDLQGRGKIPSKIHNRIV